VKIPSERGGKAKPKTTGAKTRSKMIFLYLVKKLRGTLEGYSFGIIPPTYTEPRKKRTRKS